MPGTYTRLLYHIVFSTKLRQRSIAPEIQARLHEYLGGLVRKMDGVALQIGGIEDHVHLFVGWRTNETLAALLRTVKSRSSTWIHDTFSSMHAFAWQEGYAAFTVSPSQAEAVRRYIAGQVEHHRERSFEEGLRSLLRAYPKTPRNADIGDRARRRRRARRSKDGQQTGIEVVADSGRTVGTYRAAASQSEAKQEGRTPARSVPAGDGRDFLCSAHGLPVEGGPRRIRLGQHASSAVSGMGAARCLPQALADRIDGVR